MKKLSAIVLSVILLATLALYVSAEADLTDVEKPGFTAYPLFDEDGTLTEGVTFYMSDGTEISEDTIKECIGKTWDQNTIKDSTGKIQFIVWSNSTFMAFNCSVRLCSTSSIKVVFTGTGIRFGTCYRTNVGTMLEPEIKVVIDGEEVDTDSDLLQADWADDTTPTVFYEIEGLENTTHTVTLSPKSGEFECSWFEINGTLGAAEESTTTEANDTTAEENPDTSNYFVPVAVIAVISAAGIAVVTRKKHR